MSEPTEERVRNLWTLVMGQSINDGCDAIRQALAQEAQRANERAEGLAKELEALRADREQWIIGFSAAFAREWMSDEQALLDEALRDLQHAKARGDCELAKKRKVSSLLGQACRARDAATARVAEMQDRMIAAFGEGTTADQLVAISHEHEARVAELETTLAHVERSGGIEQCLAREARIAELEKQLADKLEAVTASARVEKAEARADAAEAELARLRALPDGLRAEDGSPWRSPNVGMQVDELLAAAMHRLASGPFQALRTDLSIAATRIGVYLAAPLPSAKPQEVKCENPYHLKTGSHTGSTCYTLLTDQRFIPVAQSRVKLSPSTNCDCGLMVETHTTGDGSIREHKASCAVRRGGQLTSAPPSPEGPPATAGHNPEGVEDRGGKVPGVVCDYKTAWHSLVPHPETKSCIRPRAHPAEGPPAPGGEK